MELLIDLVQSIANLGPSLDHRHPLPGLLFAGKDVASQFLAGGIGDDFEVVGRLWTRGDGDIALEDLGKELPEIEFEENREYVEIGENLDPFEHVSFEQNSQKLMRKPPRKEVPLHARCLRGVPTAPWVLKKNGMM